MKLCEKTGRRLRHANFSAQGVHVSCVYTDLSWWYRGRKFDVPVYTTRDIYIKALRLLNRSGYTKHVRNLAVSVYDLSRAQASNWNSLPPLLIKWLRPWTKLTTGGVSL
jgi:hypothetical protein